jgi:TonB family C-terminal domain
VKHFKCILCCVVMFTSCVAAKNVEKRAQELWQNTPLMLRSCPVAGPTIFIEANGQVSGPAQEPSHDFCLLEFSSVKQVDDAIVLSGMLTQARADDDLTLKTVFRLAPFRMSLDCPKKIATEETLGFFDRSLFSHAELKADQAVPQYFRRIVEQYAGRVPAAPSVPITYNHPVASSSAPGSIQSQAGFVHAPQLRHGPDPPYSTEARSRRIEGTVVVWMIVDKDGHTRDFQITKPLGYGLDEQAIKAVRSWVFEPATKDKQPVAVAVSVQVNFHIF